MARLPTCPMALIRSPSTIITELRMGMPPNPSIKVPPTKALTCWEKEGMMLSKNKQAKRRDFLSMAGIRESICPIKVRISHIKF
jgi:hypothetical protein